MDRTRPARVIALATLVAILMAGCSVETTGMQAPLAHDYDGLEWIPLETPIEQPVLIAPAYTAAIANDPETTPAELRRRLRELPPDVRDSRLNALDIRLRPAARVSPMPAPRVQIFHFPETNLDDQGPSLPGTPSVEANAADYLTDDESVRVTDLPAVDSGDLIVIRLQPPENGGEWEYAITPGRKPYGGWFASGMLDEIAGSLAYSTTFERKTGVAGVLDAAGDRLGDLPSADPAFVLLYVGFSVSVLGIAVTLTRRASRDSPQ